MARGINKVILVGNLGKDPEVRYTANGGAVANLTIATSESWKDKTSGETVEKTEWHKVVFFGRLGEVAGEYLRKGRQVYIEGKLQTRKWTDQGGQDRYTTEIVGSEMQMLGSQQGQGGGSYEQNQGQGQPASRPSQAPAPAPNAPAAAAPAAADNAFPSDDGFDDDIPF